MSPKPISKVLVLDNSAEHAQRIKEFCEQNDLVPLKVRKESVTSVLKTNIDLGAILYSESYGDTLEETARIATEIHATRPELPIIIRRQQRATLAGLPDELQHACCRAYVASDFSALREVIDEYIFCLIYPNALLRGISEIMETVLTGQFPQKKVSFDTPYIVHDRIIFGEVLSLIQLESSWCRGYMMLQTEEDGFLELAGETSPADSAVRFRRVNDRLSEITNLIWGAFKNRYIGDEKAPAAARVQVPLVVNHKHKYISFGSGNPQLCFRYTLTDVNDGSSSTLYARFIFNLNWSPEDFEEITQDVAGLVDSGELELF
jgi:hypothetical protein